MKLKEPIAMLKPSEHKMENKPSKKRKVTKRGLKMKLN